MSDERIDFVERLVSLFPYLSALLLEHKSDNFGEILLHLFIADLARKATDMYVALRSKSSDDRDQLETSLRNLLAFLETSYRSNDTEVRELLSASFLENLPRQGEGEGWRIRQWLGPKMREQLDIIG